MKIACPLVFAALLALPCPAQEADRDAVRRLLDAFWAARKADVLAAPELPEGKAPRSESVDIHLCPVHDDALLEFLLDEEIRRDPAGGPIVVVRRHVAAYCPRADHVYVRAEGKDLPATWRGSFAARPPTKELVEKCLMRHITDSGDQGFYQDRFGDLREFGPGAIAFVFGLFEDTDDPQLKHIAVEALVEIADEGSRDRLRKLARSREAFPYRRSLGAALYRIGDPSVIDEILGSLRDRLAVARTQDEQSDIEADLGFVYSLIWKDEEAIGHYEKAVAIDSTKAVAWYNLACACSKLGRVEDGLAALEGAMRAGYRSWEWMMADGDLAIVRQDPRFQELFQAYRK